MRYLTVALASLFLASPALADIPTHATGTATAYEVTLKKLELCASGSTIYTDGSAAPTCVDPLVLGSSSMNMDIAGVAAGAQLGSYASIQEWPAGKTYTYVRLTLSRTFSIAGITTNGCRTDSGDTSSSYTSAGSGSYDPTGTGTAQTLVLASDGAYGGGYPASSGAGGYWANGLEIPSSSGDEFYYFVVLPTAVSTTQSVPNIRVAFNTSSGLAGDLQAGPTCRLYPTYPSIEISLQ
ncbi:MAG: hypothetical protein PHE27_05690 [Alphaproteobacteria bacterium]|nr:hypothetical protein [Alphaproteobacteria bacterium]